MGSKLGVILSLFISLFVFSFAVELISLQNTYTNLESIASSVAIIVSTKGANSKPHIDKYLSRFNKISVEFDDEVFKVGEFKNFIVKKSYSSLLIFQNPVDLKVQRTVLIGQYETN